MTLYAFLLLVAVYASHSVALPVLQNQTTVVADEYDFTFGDVLSTITAEFVFNIAGDHILFPVPADDGKLHRTALIMAELLRKLHTMAKVYAVLNNTSHEMATTMWPTTESENLIGAIMDKAIERFEADALLQPEYVVAKEIVDSRTLTVPPLHGKFASKKSQTMYDIRPEQMARAEILLQNSLVKKVTMSVGFLKASEYEYHESLPQWVHDETRLASAMLKLAEDAELRPSLQRMYDESLEENVDKFDVMNSGNDIVIFDTLRRKIDENAIVKNKLQQVMMTDDRNTSTYVVKS